MQWLTFLLVGGLVQREVPEMDAPLTVLQQGHLAGRGMCFMLNQQVYIIRLITTHKCYSGLYGKAIPCITTTLRLGLAMVRLVQILNVAYMYMHVTNVIHS